MNTSPPIGPEGHSQREGSRPDPHRRDLEAAPPDDGGHTGSYTVPQDMMAEPGSGWGPAPSLHRDPARSPAGEGASMWMLAVIAVIAVIVLGIMLAVYT